jgi:hypothetical protein
MLDSPLRTWFPEAILIASAACALLPTAGPQDPASNQTNNRVSLKTSPKTSAKTAGPEAADARWAFQPITRPALPNVTDDRRVLTAVDAFLQAKLEAAGLSIGPEADRRTLIRRLKFDLHGLPPTPRECDEFANDRAPDAYDRLVDRLLDSPAYGERWARHWLDVVRFAESKGYERDRIRENAWRYRDWVIQALNSDMPYGEFVRQQIAGDAIHPNDAEAAVPTGFLMTGPNNDVGNQSQLELMRERADELDEIVQNVSSVMLGLTVGCARCHDHKFDPITTLDYYRFAAVFSGVKFGDRPLLAANEAANVTERIAQWDARVKEIGQQLSNIRQDLEALGGLDINPRRNEERFDPVEARFVRLTILATKDGTEPCIDEIEIYGPDSTDGPDAAHNYALAARGAKATASSLLPGYPIHQVHHLNDGLFGNSHSWISRERGSGWTQIELAAPATISRVVWGRDRDGQFVDRLANEYRLELSTDGAAFQKLPTLADRALADPETAAKITALKAKRKELQTEKKAIDDERAELDKHPKSWAALSTAPVALQVLKRGDVLTPGEDAPPGTLSAIRFPTLHSLATDDADPARRLKFADWVADRDNALTWRVIVNRVWQYHFGSALVTTPSDFGLAGSRPSHPELLDWLADEFRRSGGRIKSLHRMIVRSAAYRQTSQASLATSVDADNRMLWHASRRRLDAETLRDSILFVSGQLDLAPGGPSYRPFKYIDGNIPVYESIPDTVEQWRRTIYRHAIRTHRQPFLDTFDCPDPSVMTPVRTQTTTPLQALSLLNNPFVLDQARHFAERVAKEAGPDPTDQTRLAFRIALQRDATPSELASGIDFIRHYGLDRLCRVILNTNEFLYVD